MPQHRRVPSLINGLAFTAGGTVHFVRGVYQFFFAPVTSLFDRTPFNTVLFLLISVGAMSWSLGFILLTGERLPTGASQPHFLRRKIPISIPQSLPEIVSEDEVREQLQRILNSEVFSRSYARSGQRVATVKSTPFAVTPTATRSRELDREGTRADPASPAHPHSWCGRTL
jgi:hypothetical protein